jgi:hypothetical protein
MRSSKVRVDIAMQAPAACRIATASASAAAHCAAAASAAAFCSRCSAAAVSAARCAAAYSGSHHARRPNAVRDAAQSAALAMVNGGSVAARVLLTPACCRSLLSSLSSRVARPWYLPRNLKE